MLIINPKYLKWKLNIIIQLYMNENKKIKWNVWICKVHVVFVKEEYMSVVLSEWKKCLVLF